MNFGEASGMIQTVTTSIKIIQHHTALHHGTVQGDDDRTGNNAVEQDHWNGKGTRM